MVKAASARTLFLLVIAAFSLLPSGRAGARQVVINEFLASNAASIAEPDFGERVDWIELFNAGPASTTLDGWSLTDDLDRPRRWIFPPATVIGSRQYVLIWADSRGVGRHASFGLDRDGERIALFDAEGALRDSVSFGPQATDVSMGRDPEEPSTWRLFGQPTPGRANTTPGISGVLEAPVADPPPGFHAGAPAVSFASPDGATVRYTTDGSEPTETSAEFAGPIVLTGTTVVRARAFREGWLASPVTTGTWFVDEAPTLPVVSLSTDPANFFDDRIGIYVVGTNGIPGYCRTTPHNWNQDWERPIHVEFYETDGSLAFAQDAGVKIFGGCTRIYPQKSLALYARSVYGPGRFRYRVFADVDKDSYNNLVLRTSAQDWWRTMFRDGLIQTLARLSMSVETQAYRPAIVFLNGEYWGIHNLREKLNEHYFADHFDLEPEELEILQNDKDPIEGSSAHYDAFLAWLRTADLSDPSSFDRAADWIDIDAYLDYLAVEIYSGNADWPGNNLKLWRPLTPDGRWRWVLYDLDMGFGGNAYSLVTANSIVHATTPNGTLWSNPPWSTYVLRTLLTNPRFRNRFIQRLSARMRTTFEPAHVERVIDSLRANIAAEIPRHKQRWPQSISYSPTWDEAIRIVREFARTRAGHLQGFMAAYFGLAGTTTLTVSSGAGGGVVEAEGVTLPNGPTAFFLGVPISLRAVADPGFRFVGWRQASQSTDPDLALTLASPATLEAVFEPASVGTEHGSVRPPGLRLDASWPNPTPGPAHLSYELPAPGRVVVRIVDVLGREIARPEDAHRTAGRHHVIIQTGAWAPGTYWIDLRFGAERRSSALVVAR